MTAGTTAPNPAELLAQGGFAGLLDEAGKHFDRIVVDSAPIHAVSDTLLLVKNVHAVCVVARAAKTPRKSVQRAIYLIQKAGGPVAGIVLNRLPRHGGAGYGYYYNSYYDYAYHGKYAKKGVYGAK
jgi:succinoglycan biosynthesis transport protein ExoP